MPYQRRYRKRKQMKRKPRAYKKRNYNKQKVHRFTRTFNTNNAFTIATGAAGAGYAYAFQLNQIPNQDDFTRLYDQYRIRAIKWQLIPKQGLAVLNSIPSGPAATAPIMPKIFSVIDYDDATAPGGLDELLQYESVKYTRANKTHTRFLKPAIADEVFGSGITTGYAMRQNAWIDCNSNQVEHYGIRVWAEGSTTFTPPWNFDIMCKFYMEFKNVR